MLVFRISALPATAVPSSDPVISHSESGHHHVIHGARTYTDSANPHAGYLVPLGQGPVELEHTRPAAPPPHGPHETLELLGTGPEIVYEYHRQVEGRVPEAMRPVLD